ncbi:MAG: glycosyltransferase family 39 protein [Planctomycetota bacterium]
MSLTDKNENSRTVLDLPEPRPRSNATAAWLLALIGWTTLLVFHDLGNGARFEPTDCWVSQTAREMYAGASTDFSSLVVPQFSGETRMQKSPGPYWAVMLTAWLRGQTTIDEVSTRIPNGVAALIIVITIFWVTRRIAGERAAVFAGFACLSSVLILYWSHRGASDLGLAALTTVSLAAVWVAAELEPPGRKQALLWLLGYFAAGLGMLYKMPMPLAIVGVPVFLYVLLRNRWRALGRPIHLVGLLVFLLPWLPWAIAVILLEPTALAKWKVEFWDRFTGDLPNVEGQRAWYFHFVYLIPPLVYCLPFSLSLPSALIRAFKKQPGINRDGMLYMVFWFVGLFAFFTISAGKELRYFLPALPPLFVLLGVELSTFFNPRRPTTPRRDRWTALAVWVLLPAGFAAGGFAIHQYWYKRMGAPESFTWAEVWQPYAVTAAIFCVGAALAAWLYTRRRENTSFGVLAATMCATWLWAWSQAMPVFVSQRPFLNFAEQLQQRIDPALQDNMRQIGSQDARIIWYSDYRFKRIIDQLELLEMQGGQRSLAREIELIGEEMVNQLAGDKLVLLVASRPHYVDFLIMAPPLLAKRGREMPPAHLWLQSELGAKSRHFVLFSNRPPPWPEPELTPPSERLNAALAQRAAPASAPTTQPTSQSNGDG